MYRQIQPAFSCLSSCCSFLGLICMFQTITNSSFLFFLASWNTKCAPKPWSIRSLYQQTHWLQHEGHCSGSEKCNGPQGVELAHVWIKAGQPPGLRLDFRLRKSFILHKLYIWNPFQKGSAVDFCWWSVSINGRWLFAAWGLIKDYRDFLQE